MNTYVEVLVIRLERVAGPVRACACIRIGDSTTIDDVLIVRVFGAYAVCFPSHVELTDPLRVEVERAVLEAWNAGTVVWTEEGRNDERN